MSARGHHGLLLAAVHASVFSAEIAADSPFLWWRLGEAAGTAMADSSGNGRSGTLSGVAPTAFERSQPGLVGDANTAIRFKTNSGYIRSNSAFTFPLTNFTKMIAFKSDVGAGAGVATQINSNEVPSTFSGARDRGFVLGSDGKMYFTFWDGSTTRNIGTAAAVNDGTPHIIHCAVGAAATELFLDGASQGSIAYVPGFNTASYMYVGYTNKSDSAAPIGVDAGFRGVLDEAAWFNSRLSAARVLSHAQAAGFA